MKKRLIALMIALIITSVPMVGCDESTTYEEKEVTGIDIDEIKSNDRYRCESNRINNKFICVDRKGEYVLHKGDIIYYEDSEHYYTSALSVTRMKFDCGKELVSNATYSLTNEMPDEEDYDRVCEECFNVD